MKGRRFLLLVMALAFAGWFTAAIASDSESPVIAGPAEVRIRGVEFVRVPAGEFWYSVEAGDLEQQRLPLDAQRFREVRVWLDAFYIAKYEARIGHFVEFMNDAAATPALRGDDLVRQDEYKGCTITFEPGVGYKARFSDPDLPATSLNWFLADAFSRWMGFRLPSEAEWQKAARGADRRIWPWGNRYPDDTRALYAFGRDCRPAPVTSYPKGQSPYGIFNMAGNVAEWTANWDNLQFDMGLQDGVRNPPLPASGSVSRGSPRPGRIIKGGRWGERAGGLAIAPRRVNEPHLFNASVGVRFAIDAATVRQLLKDGQAIVLIE